MKGYSNAVLAESTTSLASFTAELCGFSRCTLITERAKRAVVKQRARRETAPGFGLTAIAEPLHDLTVRIRTARSVALNIAKLAGADLTA